jgi:hypothetical protein
VKLYAKSSRRTKKLVNKFKDNTEICEEEVGLEVLITDKVTNRNKQVMIGVTTSYSPIILARDL